jgi:hypothetical protein
MAKSISVRHEKRGRPATGKTPTATLRLPEQLSEQIEVWSRKQSDAPTRSEAIRRLVEIGLSKSETPKRPKVVSTAKQSAARAVEMAGNAIDEHSDQNASTDERKVPKQKLIQGPSVFRDARKDRPGK